MLTAFTGVALLIMLAEYCLLAYEAVWFYRYIGTFGNKNLLAQFCTFKIQTAGYTETLASIRQSTRRHTPKTVIFTDISLRVLNPVALLPVK
jgi:hypothetical protein